MRRAIIIKNQERGVALIFTLGILALLMIMMMAFASSMLQKRRISEATSTRLETNLLVDSAINNATLQMMLTMNDSVTGSGKATTGYTFNNVVSGSNDYSSSDLDAYSVGLKEVGSTPGALDTVIPTSTSGADDYVLYKFNDDSSAVFKHPTWIYVKDNFTSNSSETYVGRYAYAVVPSYPSLDYSTAINLPEGGNRIGGSLVDIDLALIDEGFMDIENTGYNAIYSEQQLLALKKGDNLELDKSKTNPYISYNTPANLEVFRAENTYSNDNLYYRYDLGKLRDLNDVDDLIGDLEKVDSTSGTVSKTSADKLAFFNKFGTGGETTTFEDEEAWRNQVAANLIDYTRSSSEDVTSDETPSSWGGDDGKTNIPSYTGNKKTPYLNEVGMQVVLKFKAEAIVGGFNIYLESLTVKPTAELWDLYGDNDSDVYTCQIWSDFTAQINIIPAEGGTPVDPYTASCDNVEREFEIKSSTAIEGITATNGYWLAEGDNLIEENKVIGQSNSSQYEVKVNDFEGNIYAAKLSKDGKGVDFASFGDDGFKFEKADDVTTTLYGGGDSIEIRYFCSFEVNDPRQNLNAKDWELDNSEVEATNNVDDGWKDVQQSFGELNSSIQNVGGADDESDLANISTAYIREDRMQSLWELGFIHRGVAWQTLNLKKTSAADLTSPSSDSYADGDAEILDMVYIDSAKKINLNDNFVYEDNAKDSANYNKYAYDAGNLLWQALLLGSDAKPLRVNGSIIADEHLNSGDNMILAQPGNDNSGSIAPLLTKIREYSFGSLASLDGQIYRRSVLANAFDNRDDKPADDAGQEALIGKIANIVDAGQFPQVIRLLVVAQSLKPGAVVGRVPVVGNTAIASSVKKLVTIHRDATTNKFVIVNIEDID